MPRQSAELCLGDIFCVDLIKETLGCVANVSVEDGMRLTYLDYMRHKKKYDCGETDLGGFGDVRASCSPTTDKETCKYMDTGDTEHTLPLDDTAHSYLSSDV